MGKTLELYRIYTVSKPSTGSLENEFNNKTKNRKGLKSRMPYSLDLFNLCSAAILREIEVRIHYWESKFYIITYAYNAILLTGKEITGTPT